jgi:hypothetical protein
MSRAAVTVAVLLAAVIGLPSPAAADEFGFGGVDCEQFPDHPDCQVTAGAFTPVMSVGPDGGVVCRLDGAVVPCVTDEGWLGSDGCRYLYQPDAGAPSGVEGPGGSYLPACPGDPPDTQQTLVWIPDSDAPAAALAQIAVSRLSLPAPPVELSPPPPAAQLVRLPTWLWIAPQWWGQRTAEASVPGATVTAVGTPVEVRWDMGDGAVETCTGPGTPYRQAATPAEASPDCGHTYTRSSAGQPGDAYGVAATVTWEVTWSGAGGSGTEGPLFSTAELDVPVSEVQTVIAP